MIALVAANSLAVAALLYWDWSAWDLVLLVWLELVLVAGFSLARMLCVEPTNRRLWRTKIFFLPIATVVFGGLMIGVGAVMVMAFGELQPAVPLEARHSPFAATWYLLFAHRLWLPLAGLAVAHAFSFYSHYVGERQFRRASFFGVGGQFFGRVAITVIALWAALYFIMGTRGQEPIGALIGFMIAKTLLDLRALALEDRSVRPATWRELLLS